MTLRENAEPPTSLRRHVQEGSSPCPLDSYAPATRSTRAPGRKKRGQSPFGLNGVSVGVEVLDGAPVELLDPGLDLGAVADDDPHHLVRNQDLLRDRVEVARLQRDRKST